MNMASESTCKTSDARVLDEPPPVAMCVNAGGLIIALAEHVPFVLQIVELVDGVRQLHLENRLPEKTRNRTFF